MTRLILLNGLPASGKSTLARRWADERPGALALDVDVVRGMLGGWLDDPMDAGRRARGLALAMARVHLAGGRDVIVPQFLGRVDFVLQLAGLAGELGVGFAETVLVVEPQEAVRRFARRTADLCATREDRDAAVLLERLGGPAAFDRWDEQLREVVAARPGTLVLRPGQTSYPGGA